MKTYNNFSEMFNAQSGLKKDMSVFNFLHDCGDCFQVIPNGIRSNNPEDDYDDGLVECVVFYVEGCPFVNYNYDTSMDSYEQVRDIVADFCAALGSACRPKKVWSDCKTMELAETLTREEARILADRIDSYLTRKNKKYDLTNPWKEKFMMPVD